MAGDDLGTSSGMVHARYTKLASALILSVGKKFAWASLGQCWQAHARREHDESPDKRRRDSCRLEQQHRHGEDTGCQGYHSPQRPDEAPQKDAPRTPSGKELFAAVAEMPVGRERPDLKHRMLEPKADGIGQPVAENCADCRSKPDGPEFQTTCPDVALPLKAR